jgi:hypothetical protein
VSMRTLPESRPNRLPKAGTTNYLKQCRALQDPTPPEVITSSALSLLARPG